MNNTPTPRTDKAAYGMGRSGDHRDIERWCDLLNESRKLETELTTAREELETERIRLAACGVVAMADTKESRTKAREMLPEYRSASLSDVERRVDECIELREQRDKLAQALENCREDSIELLGERDWWQLENRGDYQQRYQTTRDNVTLADAALQSLIEP